MARRIPNLFNAFFNSEKTGGLLLIICTIIALIMTNSSQGADFLHWIHEKVGFSVAGIDLVLSREHWVNDGMMAIFFLLVGLEVEREIYVGELSNMRKAILPVSAAMGGMLIPAAVYSVINYNSGYANGFAIPMATDIAFALGILSLAGRRVHPSIKVFLAALAIIDDIGAIIMIAVFYTKTILFTYLAAAFALLGGMFILNRLRISNLLFYLIPGVIMWYCFLKSGVHATIAGVLLAFVIPFQEDNDQNVSYKLQHFLHKPVAFIIVPIFALVNTAIVLPPDLLSDLATPVSLGIIFGLFFGKLAGIFLFPYILVKAGWAQLQAGITWKALVGIGFLGGIGFTMSIFITNLAFTDPHIISSAKISILVGSLCAAICGLAVFMTRRKRPLWKKRSEVISAG